MAGLGIRSEIGISNDVGEGQGILVLTAEWGGAQILRERL